VEVAEQSQDVRVTQPRLYLHLAPQLLQRVVLQDGVLEHDFQGDLTPRRLLAGQVHAAKLPFAKRPPHFKVVQAPVAARATAAL
jgi:hypothetical protein